MKIWNKWTYLQNRNWLTDIENRLMVDRAGRCGMDWEFQISRYKLLHWKCLGTEAISSSTGNYVQSLEIEHDGGWHKKKNVYIMYDWVPFLYSRNWLNIVNQLYFNWKNKIQSVIPIGDSVIETKSISKL